VPPPPPPPGGLGMVPGLPKQFSLPPKKAPEPSTQLKSLNWYACWCEAGLVDHHSHWKLGMWSTMLPRLLHCVGQSCQ
jgi:hypothetical protein